MKKVFLFCVLLTLLNSCKKNIEDQNVLLNENFSVNAAKNWLNNYFKKTPEGVNLIGKEKSFITLDWNNAVLHEENDYKYVEVLSNSKPHSLFIPSNKTISNEVLNNCKKSLLIISKHNKTFVVQKIYIPTANTINSLHSLLDKDKNKYNFIYLSTENKVISFFKKSDNTIINSEPNLDVNVEIDALDPCSYEEIQEYEWICFVNYTQGAAACTMNEKGSKFILVCDDNSCMDDPDCYERESLSIYDPTIIDHPPIDLDPENCEEYAMNAFTNFTDNFIFDNKTPTVSIENIDANTKKKTVKWDFITSSSCKVQATVSGIVKFVNNQWSWESIALDEIKTRGVPRGGGISIPYKQGIPTFSTGNTTLTMTINLDIDWKALPFDCNSVIINLPTVRSEYRNSIVSPIISANPF